MKDSELLQAYIPMVKFIAALSGPRCEVVLHDLRDIEHSILAIENGHITGRKAGDGMMDFAYKKFVENTEDAFVVNLIGKKTKDNKVLRLSGYRIRRPSNKELIGLLCVTEDITDLINMHRIVSRELYINDGFYNDLENSNGGFALPLSETMGAAFYQAMQEGGYRNIANMTKNDKTRVIATLLENNIFEIKGAVSFVARKIELSEPSVYRYLKEIKNNTGHD